MKASKRQKKLLTSQQFRAVYDRGQKFHTPFFSAFFLKTGSLDRRIGITVTRKIGGAVVRNRCKRRIREALRRQKNFGFADIGYDLVINAKASLLTADFKQLERTFGQFSERIRETLCGDGS